MKLAYLICLFIWIEIMLETLVTESMVEFWLGPRLWISVFAKKMSKMTHVHNLKNPFVS